MKALRALSGVLCAVCSALCLPSPAKAQSAAHKGDSVKLTARSAPPVVPSGQPKAVSIAGFAFTPAELTISLGDTVVWINDDFFVHTTRADSGAWSSRELTRGERFILAPKQVGRFPYHCAAHPVMRGMLLVK